jgi:hypothetical protein
MTLENDYKLTAQEGYRRFISSLLIGTILTNIQILAEVI